MDRFLPVCRRKQPLHPALELPAEDIYPSIRVKDDMGRGLGSGQGFLGEDGKGMGLHAVPSHVDEGGGQQKANSSSWASWASASHPRAFTQGARVVTLGTGRKPCSEMAEPSLCPSLIHIKLKHYLPVDITSLSISDLFLCIKHNGKQILIKCKYV